MYGLVAEDNKQLEGTTTTSSPSDSITDDEIYDVLKKLSLHDMVANTLPKGLDTMIYQNGNEFSGGQKQRFQIARLLLTSRHKPVVLLDEMTSALDTETTHDVVTLLKEFCESKTLIFITHDMQTLNLADQILELKLGGKIIMKTKETCW